MNCREILIEKDLPLSFTATSKVEDLSEYSGNNAWNYNGTNGNINANNKNNVNSVRPVTRISKTYHMMKYIDILEAYLVCRGNKRSAVSTTKFEIDYILLLLQLCRDVNERVYTPSRSIAFLVTKPRLREIFAAEFRDRIIHHYLDLRIRPIIEKDLIETTCSNRVGKGVEYAVKSLDNSIRVVSNNYTRDCWICKMDLKGFFMSINKPYIKKLVINYIKNRYKGEDIETVIYLTDVTLSNCPEQNCVLKTAWERWDELPKSKSKFYIGGDYGLTIGDLISQLLANFLLNELDHYVTETLGFRHYTRYVDDFVIVHESKDDLLRAVPLIREKLKEAGVTLHPNKFYIQHYKKGVEFVGSIVKPHRIYVHNRTIHNAFVAVEKLNRITPTPVALEDFRAVINSYLGFMKNRATYNIRKRLIETINGTWMKYIDIPDDLSKVVIKKDYLRQNIIKQNLIKQRLCNKKKLTRSIREYTNASSFSA